MADAMRAPGAWAPAQREFRERYEAGASAAAVTAAAPRQDVRVRWWTNPGPGSGGTGLVGLALGAGRALGRWSRGHGVVEGTYVAVYGIGPGADERPLVQFPLGDDVVVPAGPSGSGDAVLVGELGLNGCCCVELPDGTVLWPAYNPTVPTGRTLPAP